MYAAICVIDVPPEADGPRDGPRENPDVAMPLVLINPRIVESSGVQEGREGCLSFPDIFVTIKRAQEVVVEFTGLDGQPRSVTVRGLVARAVQHELDHLDGVLLVQRTSAVQKAAVAGKLRRMRQHSAA